MSTVLITGSNRGIGYEFARQYAAEGWNVIACCRNPSKAEAVEKLAKQFPTLRVEALDVSDLKACHELSDRLKDTVIDLLINNAGILSGGTSPTTAVKGDEYQDFPKVDGNAWAKVMQVNTIAPIILSQSLLPSLVKGKNSKIVMISSGWGSIENMEASGFVAYRTSKAALNAATRNLALAIRSQKIICVAISPGWVATDMGGANADLTPADSVATLRTSIAALTMQKTGLFLRINGERAAW
jgi:short-subunit dehydrogenase